MKKLFILHLLLFVGSAIFAQTSDCTDLFISECIDGIGDNKVVEIYNSDSSAIDLTNYTISVYYDGSPIGVDFLLSGIVGPKDVWIFSNGNADPAILLEADQNDLQYQPDGNDAIILKKYGIAIDAIGEIGVDPGPGGWNLVGGDFHNDNGIIRKSSVTKGNPNWAISSAEWNVNLLSDFSKLGQHISVCQPIDPNDALVEYWTVTTLEGCYPEGYCPITNKRCIEVGIKTNQNVPAWGTDLVISIDDIGYPYVDAMEGIDYLITPKSLRWYSGTPAEDSIQYFSINILNDTINEVIERIKIGLDHNLPNGLCTGGCIVETYIYDPANYDCGHVGEDNPIGTSELSLFPNPARDYLILQGFLDGEQPSNVQILNSMGQVIQVPIENRSSNLKIEIPNLSPGLYYVRFVHNNQLQSFPFVIN